MTDITFNRLWKDALDQPDKELYISEYGYPDFFDDISQDLDEIVEILGSIHDMAHMTFRDIIKRSGLTQAAFSIKFCIPKRTIENWSTQKRTCPDYIRLMICKDLGIFKIPGGICYE